VNVAQSAADEPSADEFSVDDYSTDEPAASGASRAGGIRPLLAGSLVILAVVVGAALWSAQRIQNDLVMRGRAALAAAGVPGTVMVQYDGLNAVLHGTVTHPQQAADAIGVVIGVTGTLHVTSRLTMPTDPGAPLPSSPGTGGTVPQTPLADPPDTGLRLPPGKITFATNDTQLSAAAKLYLDQVVTFLAEHPQVRLAVRGHSDNSGPDEINWMLSRQRAAAVVTYLVSRQVATRRLHPAAFAATSPVTSNDTPDGRATNRRVELAIEENP
jgi:outer membrane protein OmpA-like peptidoglycan-associated protein